MTLQDEERLHIVLHMMETFGITVIAITAFVAVVGLVKFEATVRANLETIAAASVRCKK